MATILRRVSTAEFEEILRLHQMAIRHEEGGRRADLSDCDLSEVRMAYANLFLANLDRANLSGAMFGHINLACASLRGANLSGLTLARAGFYFANLTDANLSGANLSRTDLRKASLQRADLRNANLTDADTEGAVFSGALTDGAILPPTFLKVASETPFASVPIAPATDDGKRLPAENEKALLALLDLCLEWPEDTISERRIWACSALQSHRKQLGLIPKVSVPTVHNHLQALARLCGVDGLFELEPKKQFSRFRPGIKDKLRQLARPFLLECIRRAEGSS